MKKDTSSTQSKLTTFFGGGNGGSATSSAKTPAAKKAIKSYGSGASRKRTIEGSSFGTCPMCQKSVALYKLEGHAANCNGSVVDKVASRVKNSCPKDGTAKKSPNVISSSVITMTPDVSIKLSCTEPIPGLFVFENVLSKEEEAQMIHLLDVGDVVPWKLSRFNGLGFGKRWGVHCNLRDRRVDAPQHPLPPLLQQFITTKLPLIRQTLQQKGNTLHAFSPNEANAIDYRRQEGHWLKAHVDDRQLSKEPILNLSLVGDCIMTFQNQKKSKVGFQPQQPEEARVLLKPGTLQVLTGKARYDYSHAIAHADLLSDRRISITMRESPLTASNSFAKGGTGVVPSSTAKPILHFAWRKHHPKTQSQSKNQTLAAIKMNP